MPNFSMVGTGDVLWCGVSFAMIRFRRRTRQSTIPHSCMRFIDAIPHATRCVAPCKSMFLSGDLRAGDMPPAVLVLEVYVPHLDAAEDAFRQRVLAGPLQDVHHVYDERLGVAQCQLDDFLRHAVARNVDDDLEEAIPPDVVLLDLLPQNGGLGAHRLLDDEVPLRDARYQLEGPVAVGV
eukprot:CAMPEP_0198117528 /NCGR_PEP_ID=MMETSP1442-20131203/18442_1 /TAXON_ID= /ORGANISM="Craspedostauros australis, Strain CCMP3328" /LENGTH=179 /DNA_ID=CAMNT_0043775595 /DNA_START=427 /DNA_END=966 /DNA_ORIENTATION=-